MTTAVLRHFDVLSYVEKSKALGVDENVAKYQARQIEQAIEIAITNARTEIENKELATKADIRTLDAKLDAKIEQTKAELRGEIHKAKFEMVAWVAGLLLASGLIQHFFK